MRYYVTESRCPKCGKTSSRVYRYDESVADATFDMLWSHEGCECGAFYSIPEIVVPEGKACVWDERTA